jgi:AbiJ N-terminal domain 4
MRFSERIGAVRRIIQKDSMNEGLRNALWNAAYTRYWAYYSDMVGQHAIYVSEGKLLNALWTRHFQLKVDEFPEYLIPALARIKQLYGKSDWASVYDFVEFIATCGIVEAKSFIAECNRVLKEHNSAYRFVGKTLAPIISDQEIEAIEDAASCSGTFGPVSIHIETALKHLADRANPDPRNSMKESISAVEAACQIITKNPSATLGQALKALNIHPALERGFGAIYGYTSDAQGIRHALAQEPNVGPDDAKFFLVVCSAFVNYLISRSATVPGSGQRCPEDPQTA